MSPWWLLPVAFVAYQIGTWTLARRCMHADARELHAMKGRCVCGEADEDRARSGGIGAA